MKKQYSIGSEDNQISFIFDDGEFYLEFENEKEIIRFDVSSYQQLDLLRFLIAGE